MFYPCPHCQFLVTHHPQLRPLPADCPRCGRPLQEDVPATGDERAGDATVVPTGADADAEAGTDVSQDVDQDAALAAFSVDAGAAQPVEDDPDDRDPPPVASVANDSTVVDAAGQPAPHSDFRTRDGRAPAAFAGTARGSRWTRWSWPLVVLLALLLALQLLLADRARLAADPRWRPLVESLCGVLGCDLPAWHEPAAFTMLDRKVRPAPQAGALRVDATFRNDARWPQAWPALQLALSDADGRVLGSRVFQPADYLGASPSTHLSPGQSAQITFMVQEPAPGTVAFTFEFR